MTVTGCYLVLREDGLIKSLHQVSVSLKNDRMLLRRIEYWLS